MNEMRIFNNERFGRLRTLSIDGEAWFVGKDAAGTLGYVNANEAVREHVDSEDKLNSKTLSSFPLDLGQRGGWLINESGLYSLILSSKLESAKAFKRWVTSEVLPSIRKHGAYMTQEALEAALLNPDTLIRLAQDLKAEREQRAALQADNAKLTAKIEADASKVLYAETTAGSNGVMLIRQFCKYLKQNGGNIGEKRMFADLRENGFLIKSGRDKNSPMQRAMEMGLFAVRQHAISNPVQGVFTRPTTMLTEKGKRYFTQWYLGKREDLEIPGNAPDDSKTETA